jgi:hypothetical protein
MAEEALQRAREYMSIVRPRAPSDHPFIVKKQGAWVSKPNPRLKKSDDWVNPLDNPDPAAVAVASKGTVIVQVFVKGHPDRPGIEPAGKDEVIITTTDKEQSSEDVRCLFCRNEVE